MRSEIIKLNMVQISLKYRSSTEVRSEIDFNTSFLPSDSPRLQRIYHYFNDLKEIPKCPYCNEPRKFVKTKYYLETCCSVECKAKINSNSQEGMTSEKKLARKVKTKKTIEERYGIDLISINIEAFIRDLEMKPIEDLKATDISILCKAYGQSEIIKNIIDTQTNEIGSYDSVSQRVFHFKTLSSIPLCTCGAQMRYKNNGKYHLSCGSSDCEKLVRETTCIEKYGSKNISSSVYMLEQKTKLLLDKYSKMTIDTILGRTDDKYFLRCLCHKCGSVYEISQHVFRHRNERYKVTSCTICNPVGSSKESAAQSEILEFLNGVYDGEIMTCTRNVIAPQELDFYIPKKNVAIEFNGLYWHNEITKSFTYHIDKTKSCASKGIKLIHVWEDDWKFRKDIVQSMLLSKLGLIKIKIWARKTTIAEVSFKDAKEFLKANHLQGNCMSSKRIGLYFNGSLVSLMTFGKPRRATGGANNTGMELIRFCSKNGISVVGGASKLFKHFVKSYDGMIYSYSDKSRNSGGVYETLGFELVGETGPNYYYVVDGERRHRFNYRKDLLVKEGYDSSLSEHEIMFDRGIFRIYDCGSSKWIYKA
jgi:hypothetical protein